MTAPQPQDAAPLPCPCTCRVPVAGPADIDPPEVRRDPWCPTHGTLDADYLREDRIERDEVLS
jgi:hypothetical protein